MEKDKHYNNKHGTLYKFAEEQKLNPWEFDIIKRITRCRKKGQWDSDLEKTKRVIDLYKQEYKGLDAISEKQLFDSRDIAKEVNMKHCHILRDIRKLQEDYRRKDLPIIEEGKYESNKRYYIHFKLTLNQKKDLLSRKRYTGLVHDSVKVRRKEVEFAEIVGTMFADYRIETQYEVLGKYRIDFYIPELKIAIEYDEKSTHSSEAQLNFDAERQAEIEEYLNCTFIRKSE